MQQDYVESIVVAKNEDSIANIIHGFYMSAGLPWYMVDEVYVPINCGKMKKEPPIEIQKLAVMLPTCQTMAFMIRPSELTGHHLKHTKGRLLSKLDLDCGIFVCAYAEILSEGLQVHLCGFDAASQRARYASLLWHYGVEKANEGYMSDNGDPPRPKKSVIEEIEASAIVTLE
ncbi:hypothetical protein BC332_14439 [Capsicum chinense]|nr:hypothetical protein BC332_14439 [Capsicum chinense]